MDVFNLEFHGWQGRELTHPHSRNAIKFPTGHLFSPCISSSWLVALVLYSLFLYTDSKNHFYYLGLFGSCLYLVHTTQKK